MNAWNCIETWLCLVWKDYTQLRKYCSVQWLYGCYIFICTNLHKVINNKVSTCDCGNCSIIVHLETNEVDVIAHFTPPSSLFERSIFYLYFKFANHWFYTIEPSLCAATTYQFHFLRIVLHPVWSRRPLSRGKWNFWDSIKSSLFAARDLTDLYGWG